ncbi:hypothetical protein [Streptomyces sp. NPDC057199]|uniref:hypothetical protein n=1 Tax=Streptomyces sp. NPDC057199 TaxID=3346047 RepID=UPI003637083F
MTTPDPVPAWPRYRLAVADDATVTITGPAAPTGPYVDRAQALAAVAALAAHLRPPRAVLADAVDEDGTLWPLRIEPDGTVHEAGAAQHAKRPKRRKKTQPQTVQPAPHARAKSPRTRERSRRGPVPGPAGAVPQPPEPFVIPTSTAPDEPTARVRVRPVPADEPTTRVRATRPAAPVAEQHERPAEDAPAALRPVPPPAIPAPTPAPAPGPEPRLTVRAAPQQERAPIPSFLRIRALEQGGRLVEAAQMAAALDEAATASHGISHRAALQAREVHAHLTAQLGDLPGAVALYRDVAERWALQGQTKPAEEAAGRAHALWLRITDPGQAIVTGEAIVRMRANIPGEGGIAYRKAVSHLSRIRTATTPQPGTPG